MTIPESWLPKREPDLIPEPQLSDILLELTAREPIFHRPAFGTARVDFERMTADDFWEVGASGRRYSREYVLALLAHRHATPHEDVWEARDFHCRKLSPETYLLTYTLLQDKIRLTRRTTIWLHSPDGWKIVFHQGTLVQDG